MGEKKRKIERCKYDTQAGLDIIRRIKRKGNTTRERFMLRELMAVGEERRGSSDERARGRRRWEGRGERRERKGQGRFED